MRYSHPMDLIGRTLDRAVHEHGFCRPVAGDPEACPVGVRHCDAESGRRIPEYSSGAWSTIVQRLNAEGYAVQIHERVALGLGLEYRVEVELVGPEGTVQRWRDRDLGTALARAFLALRETDGEDGTDRT